MEIKRIDDYEEIFINKEISSLLGTSMFNPTFGKLQSVAQGIYAKTQGRFFTGRIDGLLVGLIGFSKVDNHKLIVRHLAVLSTFQRQKIASELVTFAIQAEGVQIVEAETDDEGVGFYKGYGFKVKKLPYDDARGQCYECIYEVK